MMICPKCKASMRSICSKKRDVVIEQCEQCHGYWLDQNEIFKFVKDKQKLEKFHFNGLDNIQATTLQCPRCDDAKLETGTIPNFGHEVEHCKQCHGLFFDRGELHALVHGGTLAAKKTRLKKTRSFKLALPTFFKRVLDDDEEVFWAEKPDLMSFAVSSFSLVFPLAILVAVIRLRSDIVPSASFYPLAIALIALVSTYIYLRYRNTFYVLTNKRSIISTGVLGIDFTSIDHAKVTDLFLSVTLIDRVLNCGSIRIQTASSSSPGQLHLNNIKGFIGIANPYETYRLIKSLSYRAR